MIKHPHNLQNWPRSRGGAPIFTCTEEAIYFAHLCSHEQDEIDALTRLRKGAYQAIAELRSRREPNYQRMLDLAVKA